MLFPKPTKTKRGNTKRLISKETKEYIVERDQVCIICEHEYIDVIHYAMYNSKDLWENNKKPELHVWLCNMCHYKTIFEGNNDYREKCIEYLQNYYKKIQ